MSVVIDDGAIREVLEKIAAQNERVRKARDEYDASREIGLARKKKLEEEQRKLNALIDDCTRPNPQKKLDFGPDDDDSAEDILDILGDMPPLPPVAVAPPEVKDESPSIETLDIPAKLVQLLMDNGIETVNQFTELIECKNPKFPAGPESIDGCGKKACKTLAAAYEALKYGDTAGYEPPLPEEVPPGVPVAVAVENGGEVLSSNVGDVEEVESIEEGTEEEVEPAGPAAEVKIRSKTTIEGALEMGQVYTATVTDGEACVEINGDPIMLMEGEYELVS
jgi:hypothetical protein